MFSQNRIWGVPTVPLGLMNGARGVVVAILYAGPGAGRVDGSALAGDGYPSSTVGSYPRGLVACPLPDVVVVHFLAYAGLSASQNCRAHGCRSLTPKSYTLELDRAWCAQGFLYDWLGPHDT